MMPRTNDPQAVSDDALRALYAQAQDGMSAGTTARLHRARHAALSATSAPRRAWGIPVAAGVAALFAMAAGLHLLQPSPDSDRPDEMAAASIAPPLDDNALDALATYDESPDFFLWLAANEATLLAVE